MKENKESKEIAVSNIDMTTVIHNVKMVKACSVKPFKEATESKTINVEVDFEGATIGDIFDTAMRPIVINEQNTKFRNIFDTLTDKQTWKVKFASKGKRAKSREESINEAFITFRKAGLDKETAMQLAIKAVDNPEVLS